ncbi:hypothetical protein KZ383_11835, partial [Glaesserella parasuis]|nr:hypothetical protein [Glaesserella parasuis]MCT8727228.1 hypothetical protein [Glaesserella parasuis]
MNKIFRVIWSHAQQAWVVVSELVKSHTKTSTYTNKRAQLCTSHYFLDKQQDRFKLSFLSLVLLGIFFSPVGSAKIIVDGSGQGSGEPIDEGSIGIGEGSKVGPGAITIGKSSDASGRTAVAIGYAAKAIPFKSIALGAGAEAKQSEAIAIGSGAVASSIQSVAIGKSTNASGYSSISIGYSANAASESISLGLVSKATNTEGVAIGARSTSNGNYGVAVGSRSVAGSRSASLGYQATANGVSSVAVGEQANTNQASRATALGNNSIVLVDGGVALGYGSVAGTRGGVDGERQLHSVTIESTVGNGLKSTQNVDNNSIPIGAVSVGNERIKRQITNVAAGKELTDAVNVAQLKSLTMKIDGNTKKGDIPKVGLWEGTLKVTGDNGLTSHASGDTITVKLTEDVKNKLTQIADKMSSFNIKTDKDNTEATIKDGNTIQFTAGNNISITRN